MPPDAQEINTLRIVVRPHLNWEVIKILACDIEQLGQRDPPTPDDAHKTSAKC